MDTKGKHLNIYVLNWNQANITVDCINSLLKLQSPIEHSIYIIDNGSTDNSVETFKKSFPEIEILRNSTNLGYQGGMNIGIQHGIAMKADYLMLLNNDTIADPLMLENLFAFSPKDADLVSPGIFFADKQAKLCSLGGNFNPVLMEVFGNPNKEFDPPAEVQTFEFLPSHAWLVKREIFENIGGLDPVFFPIYYDDLDFCLRMKRANYRLYLIPQAKLLHLGSMSVGGKNSPKERYLMARNSGYYFRKNMRFWNAPIIFLFRLSSGVLWSVRLIFQKNYEAIPEYWKGFIKGWFKPLPK